PKSRPSAVYFSHRHRDHRAPPSFPTRRSSDLNVHVELLHHRQIANHWNQYFAECFLDSDLAVEVLRARQLIARGSASERSRYALDRKSTRLNSSHVKISYAVFCLKKKIQAFGR